MYGVNYRREEKRLLKAIASFLPVWLGNRKVVFISDGHINNGGGEDNFKHNIPLLADIVLPWYAMREYLIVLVGDIAELWETIWQKIIAYAPNMRVIPSLFHCWFWLKGNHDWDISPFLDDRLKDVVFARGLRIVDEKRNTVGFACHGDLIDRFNRPGWFQKYIIRPFIRYIWVWIERLFGRVKERSPAKNTKWGEELDTFIDWFCNKHGLFAITAHTHNPFIRILKNGLHANCGSWVNDGGQTVEYGSNGMRVVKWKPDGTREVFDGRKVRVYGVHKKKSGRKYRPRRK